jgi:hypothetical protein
VARRTVPEVEELPEERFLGLGEQRHIHSTLPAAQNRAQRDDQQGVEVVQGGIAAPWVV